MTYAIKESISNRFINKMKYKRLESIQYVERYFYYKFKELHKEKERERERERERGDRQTDRQTEKGRGGLSF